MACRHDPGRVDFSGLGGEWGGDLEEGRVRTDLARDLLLGLLLCPFYTRIDNVHYTQTRKRR